MEDGEIVSVKVGLAVGMTGTGALVLIKEVEVFLCMAVEVVVALVWLDCEAPASWHDANIKEIPMITKI